MGLLTTDLVDGLRKATGQDDVDLTLAAALLYLNQSYWELLDKFPFREKETRGTFPTVAGVRLYNVPDPFEALRHLSLVDGDTQQHTPLIQMGHEDYETLYNEDSANENTPEKYVREGCQMILYPTPDDVYTIVMRYWTTLDDLASAQNPNMPQSWHEIIKVGAIWRVFMDAGDYQRCTAAQDIQERLINSAVPVEAKEETDNSHAHLEVIRQAYP